MLFVRDILLVVIVSKLSFTDREYNRLDVHGLTVNEAEREAERALEEALLSNCK